MAVTISKIRIARAASSGVADGQTLEDGRLVFDGTRIRVHDDATAGGKKVLMVGEGGVSSNYEALSISATGSEPAAPAYANAIHTFELTMGAGAGAYVYNILLPETVSSAAVVAGSRVLLIVRFPAVDAYHADVYMTTTANPKLMRLSSTGGMASACCEFIWTGANWKASVPNFSAAG